MNPEQAAAAASLLRTLVNGYEGCLAEGDTEAARLALEVLIREAQERLARLPAGDLTP